MKIIQFYNHHCVWINTLYVPQGHFAGNGYELGASIGIQWKGGPEFLEMALHTAAATRFGPITPSDYLLMQLRLLDFFLLYLNNQKY